MKTVEIQYIIQYFRKKGCATSLISGHSKKERQRGSCTRKLWTAFSPKSSGTGRQRSQWGPTCCGCPLADRRRGWCRSGPAGRAPERWGNCHCPVGARKKQTNVGACHWSVPALLPCGRSRLAGAVPSRAPVEAAPLRHRSWSTCSSCWWTWLASGCLTGTSAAYSGGDTELREPGTVHARLGRWTRAGGRPKLRTFTLPFVKS